MKHFARTVTLLALGLLSLQLIQPGAVARQDEAETPLPGVSIETLARSPSAGNEDEDLVLLRATLAPDAYIPAGVHPEVAVLAVETGSIYLAPLVGVADVTRQGGAGAEPVGAGDFVTLSSGDAAAYAAETRVSIGNPGDGEATVLFTAVAASAEPIFVVPPPGSFRVETYACPPGMTAADLFRTACATSEQSLVQWTLRSDRFAAPLTLAEATVVGATTNWEGLPEGTYFVELTAEAFAPRYVDYFIPSSNQVTRQDERTTRIYYDAARSRGSIGAFVFAGEATETGSGSVSLEPHNCPPGTVLADIQVQPCTEPLGEIDLSLTCGDQESLPLATATVEGETFTWTGVPFGVCRLDVANLPNDHDLIYIFGDTGPPQTYDGIASHQFTLETSTTNGGGHARLVVYLVDAATAEDGDGDGLPDATESELGTDPANRDSDGDLIDDGTEVRFNTDPLDPTSAPG